MSHYSDIGFKVENNQDVDKIINDFFSTDGKFDSWMEWKIENSHPPQNLIMRKKGKIRFFAKVDEKNILDFSFSHDNERISKVEFAGIKNNENKDDFKILAITKDDIPFWFDCPNAEIFNFDTDDKSTEIKIASFANYVEIKNVEDIGKTEKHALGAESYISKFFENDYTTGWVSGIIKSWTIETNSETNTKYYAIDADCMGLYFKMLVDCNMINKEDLKVGKVICGEFWNTAILVADNHPDYF